MHSDTQRGISASPEPAGERADSERRTRRTAHSKSRSGCLRCKKRRVKCNEARPKCRACELRGETCRYPTTKPCTRCNRLVCVCVGDYMAPPSSIEDWADFECTFHYARYTYDTLIKEPFHQNVKPLMKPPECLNHPFLTDLLLALSAAHLAVLKPTDSHEYGLRAINYQNRALSGFNAVLQNPEPDSLVAMFTFSGLLGILEVAISRNAGAQQKRSFVETVCALMRLFRGSALIMSKAKEVMCDELWKSIFRDEDSMLRIRHMKINHDDFPMPDGEPLDDMLAEIDHFLPADPTSGHSNGDGHRPNEGRTDAVKYLRRLTAIQVPDGREAELLSWPALWTDDFMRDVQEGELRCEATLACYGLILRHINNRWWAKDFGKDLVLEIASGASKTVLGPVYDKLLSLIAKSTN